MCVKILTKGETSVVGAVCSDGNGDVVAVQSEVGARHALIEGMGASGSKGRREQPIAAGGRLSVEFGGS